MKLLQPELIEIRRILNANPKGLSIQKIAELLGANRNSVAKYLEILLIQGSADLKKLGNAKIYMPAFRYPAETIQHLCKDCHLLMNHELSIVHCSDNFLTYLGSVPGSIVGSSLSDLIFPLKAGDRVLSLATAAVRGKEGSIRVVPKWVSSQRELHISLLPIVFSTGRPGAALIIRDLCEERTAEEWKTGSFEFERALFDQMFEIYCRLSPDQIVLDANTAFSRLCGQKYERLMGSHFRQMVPNEDWVRTSGRLLSLTPDRPLMTIKHRLLVGGGDLVRWVLWRYRAIFSRTNELLGFLCTGLDITDHMHAKERLDHIHAHLDRLLRKRTDELRRVNRQLVRESCYRRIVEQHSFFSQYDMDHTTEMILWIDRQGMITRVNRRGKEVLGVVVGEPMMPQIEGIVWHTSPGEWEELWRNLARNGSVRLEWVVQSVDGSLIPVEMTVHYLSSDGKEYACFFIRDISERLGIESAPTRGEKKNRPQFGRNPDIIYRITMVPEISVKFLSPSVKLLTGYTPEHFYAHPGLIDRLLDEGELQKIRSYLKDPFIFKSPLIIGFRRIDQSRGVLELSGRPFWDDPGRLVAVEGTCRERVNEQHVQTASSPVEKGICHPFDHSTLRVVIGMDLRIEMIDRRGCMMLGCDEREVLGKNWLEHFIPASEREFLRDLHSEMLVDCRTENLHCQNTIIAADGTARLISWHITVLKDLNRIPRSLFVVGDEVTARVPPALRGMNTPTVEKGV